MTTKHIREILDRMDPDVAAGDKPLPREHAPTGSPTSDAEAVARRLAKLPYLKYEAMREAEAKRLDIRVKALDEAVKRYRMDRDEGGDGAAATSVVETLAPWPTAVDGFEVAESVRSCLLAHIVFPSTAEADAAVLWVLGTYLMDRWRLWPKLQISSPEKRCGKTNLIEVLEAHVHRGLLLASITGPALFRIIEQDAPCLLIDEAERLLRDREELNGIINAGHTRRTAKVIRTVEVKNEHIAKVFSVWAPQVFAGIGKLADTLEDRSVKIMLHRRLPTEPVTAIPADLYEKREETRRKIARWTADNAIRIGASETLPPPCGNDRARNNWTPLYRIAETLGGAWPDRVQAAYTEKETTEQSAEDSARTMALADVMDVFNARGEDRLKSSALVAALVEIEDRPWSEWRRGKPITANSLASLLKPFGIRSRDYRFADGTAKGYERSKIAAAYARYVPQGGSQTATPRQSSKFNGLGENQTATSDVDVADENPANPLENNTCRGVADQSPPAGDSPPETDPGGSAGATYSEEF